MNSNNKEKTYLKKLSRFFLSVEPPGIEPCTKTLVNSKGFFRNFQTAPILHRNIFYKFDYIKERFN